MPHQETRSRQLHLGLRRGGDDGMVVVADDDIANAHGDTNSTGPLDLGAANLHGVAVADIVLDGCSEPRRRDVEIDGTCTKPPPQRAETADENDGEGPDHDGQPLQPAIGGQPAAQCPKSVTEAVEARIGTRQQPARPMARRCFLIRIPVGVVPFLRLLLTAAPIEIPIVILGRRIPCHCLSIQAPIVGLSTAGTAAVRGKRSSLRRHCRHTSNIPAVRHFAPGARSTSSGVVRGIPCNHTPASPDLPRRGRDSGTPDESLQYRFG